MTKLFRKARENDIKDIVKLYDKVHDLEESGQVYTGWKKELYPNEKSALEAIHIGDMFVYEVDGEIVAAARINQEQVQPTYSQADWLYEAKDDEIMTIHTLVVDIDQAKMGYGADFIRYYESYAKENSCNVLRLDTNVLNTKARALYKKLGYREAGVVNSLFNGIPDVGLVCLEKKL